jgi:succinate dehydrogenase / fumarate reductase, membrane anchor subunit
MAVSRIPTAARIKGSARQGSAHFVAERVTALALVPLSLWAVYAVITLAPMPFDGVVAWLQHPWNAVLAVLFIGVAFRHMGLGMQVVIEDYIHKHSTLIVLLLLNGLVWGAGAVVAIVSILKVAFSGAYA